ncbi:TMEM175 family protein [Kutzneria sp. CA-103260]|uniref:TMEM175 family protein n=1 Tax=Kutzneria sp. CA-103260 TaxID=2802641 RepID=UPI001BA5D189|nr:TMEM175 family protein [Kutzneria sp. CA-103260]QUQ63676.1 hypothetical protein JJ691_13890 [Kutzneria sp. CA-103260]
MSDKPKSAERLVFFSDAVVAIALTLLVLPLVDSVSDARKAGPMPPLPELLADNRSVIFGFLISFVVIVRLWIVHHRVFEQVKAYSMSLVMVNVSWLLTVVFLPFPTELIANYPLDDRLVLMLYVGTLFVSSVLLAAMVRIVRNDPEVRRAPDAVSDRWWFDAITGAVTFFVILALVTAFPVLSYYTLALLLVQPQIVRLRYRATANKHELAGGRPQ